MGFEVIFVNTITYKLFLFGGERQSCKPMGYGFNDALQQMFFMGMLQKWKKFGKLFGLGGGRLDLQMVKRYPASDRRQK